MTEEFIAAALGYVAKNAPVGQIAEAVANWFAGSDRVADLHAALDAAAIRRAKALKQAADEAAFGPEQGT
jgi:DNA-binding NarL/FixJ family response regulator